MKRTLRACGAIVVAAVATIGVAAPALSHVQVSGTDASQGGYGVATFRVPTESDTASTTELRVTLPDDTAYASPKLGR
ncbi:DUF1775 domain-containing protein [Mycolicibacterium madagascariense]|nr:DUF1775 domain-containing protein [Mycolicibacterium madagascariense]